MNTARNVHAHQLQSITDTDITALYHNVFNQCVKHLRNFADAQDVAQIAIMQALKYKNSFNHQSSLSSWLYTITRNECNLFFRRQSRQQKILNAVKSNPPITSCENLQDPFLRNELQNACANLTSPQKQVLYLTQFTPQLYKTVAKNLNFSLPSVKAYLNRARKVFLEVV